jgi:hypothetical protein
MKNKMINKQRERLIGLIFCLHSCLAVFGREQPSGPLLALRLLKLEPTGQKEEGNLFFFIAYFNSSGGAARRLSS